MRITHHLEPILVYNRFTACYIPSNHFFRDNPTPTRKETFTMFAPTTRFAGLTAIMLFGLLAVFTGHSSISCLRGEAQEPAKSDGKGPKLQDLLKERLAVAEECAKEVTQRYKNGQGTIGEPIDASRMAHEAALELCESNKDRIAVLEKFLAADRKSTRLN